MSDKKQEVAASTAALERAPVSSLAGMFGVLSGFQTVTEPPEPKTPALKSALQAATKKVVAAPVKPPIFTGVNNDITGTENAIQTEIISSTPVFDPYDQACWESTFRGKTVMEMTKKILRGAYNQESLVPEELRFMITNYLRLQRLRIRYSNQIKAIERDYKDSEIEINPVVLTFMKDNFQELEEIVLYVMGRYVNNHPVGPWFKSLYGVGPVVSGGMLAYFDINQAPTAGHFWAYAGLDPMRVWEKGQKRPWNAVLKMLAYYLGCCIQKCCNNPSAQYGQMYLDYKEKYTILNEQRAYKQRADEDLEKKRYTDPDVIEVLKTGMLPTGHISARAKRTTVKIVISHLHHVLHWAFLKAPPPVPFVIAHKNHVHYFKVPNWCYDTNQILIP